MSAQQFEPMSIGQIINRTFRIYRMNFVRFIAIAAVVYVPVGLLWAISQSLIQPAIADISHAARADDGSERDNTEAAHEIDVRYPSDKAEIKTGRLVWGGVLLLAAVLFSVLGYSLCTGALMKSVSETYLGHEVSVGEAYRFVWPKVWTIIGAAMLVGSVTSLGFLLLVVPGIIFALRYAITTPAIVLENLKARQGMKRSKQLASGNLGKVFGVGFVAAVISLLIGYLAAGAGGIVGSVVAAPESAIFVFLVQIFSIGGHVLATPISTGAMILLYYDLRIRKEGFDLEMLAKSLGPGEAS